MDRRFLEAGELQPGIVRLLLALIAGQRLLVGVGEAFHDREPPFGRVHVHEAPGLAEPNRRRMAGDFNQRIDSLACDRIGPKAPHVAPPQHEVAELRAERGVERSLSCLSPVDDMEERAAHRAAPPAAFRHGAPVASRHSTNGSSPIESALA